MQCSYFDAARCLSCTHMGKPYDEQLAGKQLHCQTLLSDHMSLEWLPPVASRESGFRNKAKMVVTGNFDLPTLGILRPDGRGVDLRDCPLHTPGIQQALPVLADFVGRARLEPYDLSTRRGELKHLLVTESPAGELLVRFVLRSTESLARIRKHLPALHEALPGLAVASVNLQPEHKAVLEGEREVLLTEQSTLPMRVNDVTLHLRPQSFFQTNTEVAASLYRIGRDWVAQADPASVWDLYCGVGGFALHVADPAGRRRVTGIEVSAEAVASAGQSRDEAGLADVRFEAGDATAYALAAGAPPDLVVVNPPRRGIGAELAGWQERSGVRHVLYSSCNAQTLAKDLDAMPSLRPVRGQLLDMFPNTAHYEVLTLLERS